MDIFTFAAPIFDLAMKFSGHHKTLVELADRVKDEENKVDESRKMQSTKLLDLGGGTGELPKYLPENIEVTIADPSEAMLKKALQKNYSQKVEHVVADGAELPFEDNKFDYITISDALHHFREVKQALTETERVLKKGGKMFILEFDPDTTLTKTIIFFEKIAGEPVNFFKPEKLAELLQKNGVETSHEYLNKSIYVMKAEKKE